MIYLQTLIDGLLTGSMYACVAVGLSLSFGIMKLFNWAQGDFFMIGMFLVYFLIHGTGMAPYLAILIMVPLMFALGFLLQKTVLNPLVMRAKEQEPLSVMLTTAGLSYVLYNGAIFLFSTNSRTVQTAVSGKMMQLNKLFISVPKLIAFVIILAVAILLQLFLNKTELGRALRATAQDKDTAQLMGMNHRTLYCLALAINFACLGLAACLMIPMYAVSPTLGNTYGFKSMIIVVLGGKGSVPGALLGGILIGLIETFGALFFSSLYAQILVFALFALVLFLKPNGLLGKEG